MKVTFFQRKPIRDFHFSVEIIFNDVRSCLPTTIAARTWIAPFYSKGILPRIFNMLSACMNQSEVNHITGDISFIGILLKKSRTVQTILDCVFLKNKTGIKKKILKYLWLDLPVKRCAIVTTISVQVQKEIIELTGCPEDKVRVVPIALSSIFKPRPFKPFSSIPRILMIGSAPNKNILRCLEALRNIPCEIHMVAKQEDEYIKALDQTGYPYYYESGLNQEQMSAKYQQMDILLFASTYEGFGMPIIEAQAIGLPVVTSNISSMPEVAGDGAQLVDPFDIMDIKNGILKLINDPAHREALVNMGFENIKRFNPVAISEQYAAIYHNLSR